MNDAATPIRVLTAGGAGVTHKRDQGASRTASTDIEAKSLLVRTDQTAASESAANSALSSATAQNKFGDGLEYEIHSDDDDVHVEDVALTDDAERVTQNALPYSDTPMSDAARQQHGAASKGHPLTPTATSAAPMSSDVVWLSICFFGIMASFVFYGLLLEYTTSGGRKLHELSFLFVTSALYTVTAAAGRYVRDETPTTIPPARFAVLGLTSMASTWCSIRSLRYIIFPIQVLAKSCKPVPVMLMGAVMGKKYPARKYVNVCMIVTGVALFMGFGDKRKKEGAVDNVETMSSSGQLIGILLLFVSLCFDGGTGAYEDKLMSVHSVQPFDLMFNIQLGKTILAGVGLLVFNQLHIFIQMVQDMGFLLVGLGFTGALGQVFIFVTIAKFGALTCSIIGLARKVTTLVASIYFYGHSLNTVQMAGLALSVASMVMDFMGKQKKGGGGGGHHHGPSPPTASSEEDELKQMLGKDDDDDDEEEALELTGKKP